jgi:hypothetical protein
MIAQASVVRNVYHVRPFVGYLLRLQPSSAYPFRWCLVLIIVPHVDATLRLTSLNPSTVFFALVHFFNNPVL